MLPCSMHASQVSPLSALNSFISSNTPSLLSLGELFLASLYLSKYSLTENGIVMNRSRGMVRRKRTFMTSGNVWVEFDRLEKFSDRTETPTESTTITIVNKIYLIIIGIVTDVTGIISIRWIWNTLSAARMVMESEIFSPLSNGSRNTTKVRMLKSTQGANRLI